MPRRLDGPIRRCARLVAATALLAATAHCAAGGTGAGDTDRTAERALYKPGASIDSARSCECRECFDRTCCSGETREEVASEETLGMTLATCGRCTRRVWTVRGEESCAERAPIECCPNSVAE